MAITIVDTATDETGSGSVNSRSMSLPTNSSGDLMILMVSWSNSGASATTPSGWTLLDSFGGGNHANFIYYRESTGSEANVTISLTGGFLSYAAACVTYAGADLTSGITNHSENTRTGSGDWDWPALTANDSGSAIVRVGAGRQGSFPSPSGDTAFTQTVAVTNSATPTRGVVGFYHDLDGGATGTISSLTESNGSYTSYGLYTIEIPASGGGGGTTVTLPDPTLSEGIGYDVSVSYAALSLTLDDPTLSESVGYDVSVSYAALLVELSDPTLGESVGFAPSVSYGALTVTLDDPSLGQAVGYDVAVTAGAVTVTLDDPTLSESVGYDVAVTYAPLTIALNAPTLGESVGYEIQVSYANLEIQLDNPSFAESVGYSVVITYGTLDGVSAVVFAVQENAAIYEAVNTAEIFHTSG